MSSRSIKVFGNSVQAVPSSATRCRRRGAAAAPGDHLHTHCAAASQARPLCCCLCSCHSRHSRLSGAADAADAAATPQPRCRPTPCLRRLLPERDLGPCCHAADPCPCASSSRPGRVATRPCPRSYRRSCDVILIAAAASLARRPWGLEGATCSGGNSLDSRRRPCSRLTLPFGLWQWLSLPCPPPSPGCGIRVFVGWGVCEYTSVCLGYVCV